ncbi:MAG: MFS transporter [Thermoplasmata archaeon]
MGGAGTVRTAAGGQVYDPRSARNMLVILAGMALMVTYVETMVLPSFENFTVFFDYPPASTVVWILSAYLLVGVVATPVFGKLGDIYGKKRMLLVAMGIYAVAVSIAGFTPSIGTALGVSVPDQIYLLIGARAFQGIGMGMFPLAFAMIPEFYPARDVGRAQGIISAMFAGGAVVGLVGGGWLAQDYGWEFTYHTVIPFAVVLPSLAYGILRESPTRTGEGMDIPGISSLGLGLAFLMLAITESSYWGWTRFTGGSVGGVPFGVPEFLLLALACFGFFGAWEGRARSPVIRLRSLKERNILVSNVNGVIAGLVMFLTFTTLTIVLELYYTPGISLTGFGQSEFWMGIVAVPAALSMLLLGMPIGRLTSRLGPKPVMLVGFGLTAAGGILLSQYGNPAWHLGLWTTGSPAVYLGGILVNQPQPVPLILVLGSILVLVGNVGVLIAMSNIIVLTVPPGELGVQTGMNQTFRNLGSAVGPVMVSSIIAGFIARYTPDIPGIGRQPIYEVAAFSWCFAALAAIGLLGLGLSAFLRNYRFTADGVRTGAPAGSAGAPAEGPYPRAIFPEETTATGRARP